MSVSGTGTASFFDRARLDMAGLRQRAETYQQQIATGERLSRSSDDPVAASRLRGFSRAGALSAAQAANASRAETDLKMADSALAAIADAVTRARELAIQAANGMLNADQRAAIGTELEHIHANLFALANSRDSAGHALFGGQTTGPAYTLDGAGNAVYAGTPGSGALDIGEGQSVARGLSGPEIFGLDTGSGPTDTLAVIGTLAAALKGAVADPAGAARDALA